MTIAATISVKWTQPSFSQLVESTEGLTVDERFGAGV